MTSLKNLSPANFAFIMSTGVLSIIFNKQGWVGFSRLFLLIGLIGYLALVALFLYRITILKKETFQDFIDVQKMFKYLTFSAGSNALAVALTLNGYGQVGIILGVVGVLSAILLTYTLFCTLFFHVHPSIQTISPFWLLLAIACNYCGITLTTFWQIDMLRDPAFLLLAFCFWTFGVFIYFSFMALNLYRMFFFRFDGEDLDPCYWTCMGAAAIAVVDGSQFIIVQDLPAFFGAIKPFMEGVILALWALGTAWIPILVLMGLWKWAYFKVPFRYQTSLWAMVFPVGMYTAATDILGTSLQFPLLQKMVAPLLWITFLLWCLVFYMSRLNPFGSRHSLN